MEELSKSKSKNPAGKIDLEDLHYPDVILTDGKENQIEFVTCDNEIRLPIGCSQHTAPDPVIWKSLNISG